MSSSDRPRLSVYAATSLDEATSPGEDYGWELFISGIDALAMGRGTFDHISHLEPLPFGGRQVFVFTHRPTAPVPPTARATAPDPHVAGILAERSAAGPL